MQDSREKREFLLEYYYYDYPYPYIFVRGGSAGEGGLLAPEAAPEDSGTIPHPSPSSPSADLVAPRWICPLKQGEGLFHE